MPKTRNPRTQGMSKLELGESWVVQSDEEAGIDSCYSSDSPELTPRRHSSRESKSQSISVSQSVGRPRRRPSKSNTKAGTEPEFVMPSFQDELSSARPSPVKRKYVGTKTPIQSRREDIPNRVRTLQKQEYMYTVLDDIIVLVKPIFDWFVDVLGGALHLLKTPISYAIAIYLIFGCMILLRNLLTSSIYSALSPVCRIPGSSFLNLDMCKSPALIKHGIDDVPPVEFDQLMSVQSKWEDVMKETATSVSLPRDMKNTEASIRDLKTVVSYSQLRSKNELGNEFDGFIQTARMASYDLQRFHSHVGRGVDNILATARWTMRALDDVAARENSRGALAVFASKVLSPFQPVKFSEDAILDQYIQYTHSIEREIARLLEEAQALLQILQNLEDRLDVIYGITIREGTHVQGSKDEVLAELWTMLGGNKTKLGKFEADLRLLRQVNHYRKNAFQHVAGTILKLQSMGGELESLRDRVGDAELSRNVGRDVPLRVHIENVQLGLERLESGRSEARSLEESYLKGILDQGKEEKTILIDP